MAVLCICTALVYAENAARPIAHLMVVGKNLSGKAQITRIIALFIGLRLSGGKQFMANIRDAIDYVLANEGGFTIDDGGWTMWGITVPDVAAYRGVHQSKISEDDIKNLTEDEATEIYYRLYWQKMSLDGVWDVGKATCIFDVGVNRGVTIGAKYAQKAASVCGRHDTIDGIIGGLSLSAINAVDKRCFISTMEALSWAGYLAIAHRDPAKYSRYLDGWLARAKRLLTLI